jgi:hypothetical protein
MVLTILSIAAALMPAVQGESGRRGLIQQALDEPARITLENVTLAAAIDQISEQTGVRVVMRPEVMALAPKGEATVINKVDIANLPLREGLRRLFPPLGMSFDVRDDHVEVLPHPALARMMRAPTWAELDTLAWLGGIQPGIDDEHLDALRLRLQFQVADPNAWKALERAMQNVRAGPGDEVLTVAAGTLGWTWVISDRSIQVLSAEQLIDSRLQQRIDLRLRDRTLFDVMQSVGSAVGVRVQVEPGALQALPPQVQKNFQLDVRNRSAAQAFDEISAYTGLGYLIGPEGVLFYRGVDSKGAPITLASSPGAGDPYVGKVIIDLGDGKSFEWLIRRSELPEDLREMREREIQASFELMRRARSTAAADQ